MFTYRKYDLYLQRNSISIENMSIKKEANKPQTSAKQRLSIAFRIKMSSGSDCFSSRKSTFIQLSRFAVIADRYIYLASVGITFIIACYVVHFVATQKGGFRKITIGCFACVTCSLILYSNIHFRDWKDTDSIKEEMRELLNKRKDYVAPELEKLMEDENSVKEEEEAPRQRADTKPCSKPFTIQKIALLQYYLLNY